MKVFLNTIAVFCLVAFVACDDCSVFCKSNCDTVNLVCTAFPVNTACPLIKTQCDTACDTGCACYSQCVAACPPPSGNDALLQIFSTFGNLGCQSSCAVRCEVKLAIQTAASSVASLTQTVQGLLGALGAGTGATA